MLIFCYSLLLSFSIYLTSWKICHSASLDWIVFLERWCYHELHMPYQRSLATLLSQILIDSMPCCKKPGIGDWLILILILNCYQPRSDNALFYKIQSPTHCLYQLLPAAALNNHYNLRPASLSHYSIPLIKDDKLFKFIEILGNNNICKYITRFVLYCSVYACTSAWMDLCANVLVLVLF